MNDILFSSCYNDTLIPPLCKDSEELFRQQEQLQSQTPRSTEDSDSSFNDFDDENVDDDDFEGQIEFVRDISSSRKDSIWASAFSSVSTDVESKQFLNSLSSSPSSTSSSSSSIFKNHHHMNSFSSFSNFTTSTRNSLSHFSNRNSSNGYTSLNNNSNKRNSLHSIQSLGSGRLSMSTSALNDNDELFEILLIDEDDEHNLVTEKLKKKFKNFVHKFNVKPAQAV